MAKINIWSSGVANLLPVAGSMLTLGVFVLPAVAYHEVGTAMSLAYFLSALLMLPTALSMAELGTAMPGDGGAYFYVGRSMGPMLGFFAGIAKWLAMILKGAFALLNLGVIYLLLQPAASELQIRLLTLAFLLLLFIFEILTGGRSSKIYVALTVAVLLGLLCYLLLALPTSNTDYTSGYSKGNFIDILKVTGLVSVAFYEGLMKISVLSSKMQSPRRSVPALIFGTFLIVTILYLALIFVSLGNLSPTQFDSSSMPLVNVALQLWGIPGKIALLIIAVIALSVSASLSLIGAAHVPQAMAQDGLLAAFLARSNQHGFAWPSYLVTTLLMALAIAVIPIDLLVKIASGMLLLLFTLLNLAVIVLRESKIVAYRPTYTAPLYPLPQVIGIFASLVLIFEIGNGPLLATLVFFVVFSLIYLIGGKKKDGNDAALRHLVGRMASREVVQGERLDDELVRILKQRDNIEEDRFDRLIRKAIILDLPNQTTREQLFNKLASAVALRTDLPVVDLIDKLEQRERQSTTQISPTLAVPHLIHDDMAGDFVITVVRCLPGIKFEKQDSEQLVHTVFCLAGSSNERQFHLKTLMHIAQIVQDKQFQKDWLRARDEEEIRNAILLAERQRHLSS